MIQTLRIDEIPMSLNVYRNQHHRGLYEAKKYWEGLMHVLVRQQGLQPILGRVSMVYEFHFADSRRRDASNQAVAPKFIEDALVKAGILPDDNFDVIQEITIRKGENARPPYIMVYMEEL